MRYLVAVASAMALCVATSIVAAAQSADMPALPQVRPGGLFANRSPEAVIDLARNNAAQHAGVSPDQVSVVNVQSVEWPNFALGCPTMLPPFAVAEVTVPGFIVELDVAGTPVVYHTDRGLRAIPCEAPPAPTPPDATSG